MDRKYKYDICIVGGCGHVGLPLGITFADRGLKVCLIDKDLERVKFVKSGVMPFIEYGADQILKKVLQRGTLRISSDQKIIAQTKNVIIATSTPVDEYLNPEIRSFLELFNNLSEYLNEDQIIIIRSTVYPGICEQVVNLLGKRKGPWHVSYCPERIAQGYAVKELKELPQLVSGFTKTAVESASKLFSYISPKIIRVSVKEAELAKLFTNAWRYIQFATANQFYMIAHSFNVDFGHLRKVMREGYERAIELPSAGFTAGPCLLKDTMQLAASYNNNFLLGHTAMMINEGLPNYIVEKLKSKYDLAFKKLGILGMAFKRDVDDTRNSLSYKLCKILRFNGAKVLCSDEFVKDSNFVTKEELVTLSDIIIIGVPHSAYVKLKVPKDKKVIDLWGIISQKKDINAI